MPLIYKVLFVDDDVNLLYSYKRQFDKLFCVEIACGAEEGLTAIANRGPFCVVISDLRMPRIDGIEFLSHVKDIHPDSVRIMLTGHADLQKAIDAVNKGSVFRFLAKPCEPDTLVSAIADGIGHYTQVVLERSVNRKVLHLSLTDSLTGGYNRTYLTEHLPNEIKRAKRCGHSLSIVLCDIDNFKRVNDTYGHGAGDQVLQAFAQCISESIRRDVDWFVRYGGEEFLIVFPETDIKTAHFLAERLRAKISQASIDINQKKITITASFGLTGFENETPDEKISPDYLIAIADKFLYKAKEQGRNRVVGE
ncbi:MAG: diguanylate cyclase [Candidatus Scalindua sp. AMX11]|nr:MAG: diguanylate cyclase [Candidatus Scalindua sp.]NOG85713.1 diguanylate cyclase [Planctomycetota bacterium]RZV73163.1 MAG: diguanylate cyclase [Candidatus Scalindua sp. SCAELEC01]TDE64748.1 MAG: diguanylate cyclase [Candidatus Scalindua sp. AMX11]GJQ58688.1 MAG: diguanylate cyclase response regulator [Candidatus Scalindua sp.]